MAEEKKPFSSVNDNIIPKSTKLKYVKLGYHYLVSNFIYFIITFLILAFVYNLSANDRMIQEINNHLKNNINIILAIILIATIYFMSHRPRKVYLIDFTCYKPNDSFICSRQKILENLSNISSEESVAFMKRVLEKCGLGDKTYAAGFSNEFPPKCRFECARKEAEMVMCGAIDGLLAKTGVNPKDIGILIVNSTVFNTIPSLSSMIVNRYKLREDVVSFNLGGMGCSASLIAVDLAKRLLQVQPDTYALVVSAESISHSYYAGKDKSKLLTNCLFRMGGAAILLTNRSSDYSRSKYELTHIVRTHKGANDKAYKCVFQEEDDEGNLGITLSKDLMVVAGEVIKANITTLGPLVLPMSEQLLFFATLLARKLFKMKVKLYIPDLKLAFEHFCIHTGGRAVLDELEKNLRLTEWHMEPSRMTLYRFGNTNSSSVWYELAYAEAKGRIKKGDRVWQIAFGSGFKCGSGVWRALKDIGEAEEKNTWTDEVDQFPVQIPSLMPLC